MAVFHDKQNRAWEINLDFLALKKIRSLLGVEFFPKERIGLDWIDDIEKVSGVVFILIEAQLKAASIPPEDFAAAFYGDSIIDAINAIYDAMVFFCPNKNQIAILTAMKDLAGALNGILSKPVTASPELSELIPEPGRSGN